MYYHPRRIYQHHTSRGISSKWDRSCVLVRMYPNAYADALLFKPNIYSNIKSTVAIQRTMAFRHFVSGIIGFQYIIFAIRRPRPVSENSPSYAQSIDTSSGETLGSRGFLLPGDILPITPAPLLPEAISPDAQVPPNVQSSTSIFPSLGEPSNSILTPASPTLIPTYIPFESYVTAEGGNVIGSQTFTPFESSATDA